MTAHRWIGGALALWVLGCGGRVDMDEVDGFGLVQSSALVKLQAGEEEQIFTVLSTAPGICRKLRRSYQDYSVAYEAWADTLEGGDLDAACQQRLDMTELGAELSKSFMSEGDSLLYISFWEDDESFILPEDGTWQLEGEERGFYGYVNHFGANPYSVMVDTWSRADCDSDSAQVDASVTRYWLDDGFMDVDMAAERRISGRIEAQLQDEDSQESGAFDARVRAGSCDIELETDHPYFILF